MIESTLSVTLSNQTAVLAKRLYAYRGYTAANLKTRASVPDAADITVGATYVDCNNITTTKISNAIVVSSHVIGTLCHHANVNKWSAFSPYIRAVVGGMLTHALPIAARFGDFGGYNHNALVPRYSGTTHDDDVWIAPGETVHFSPTVVIGELKYTNGDIAGHSDCVGLALTVWDGASLVAQQVFNLDTQTDVIYPDATLVGGSSAKTYTCKTYLVNSLASFDYTLTNVVCQIAELANYTKYVGIKQGSGGLLSSPTGWVISGTPLSFNLTNGTIALQGLHNPSYNGHLTVSAYVRDWLGNTVTDTTVLWTGTYSGDYGIVIGSVVIWKVSGVTQTLPVSIYGYTAVVYVNPT